MKKLNLLFLAFLQCACSREPNIPGHHLTTVEKQSFTNTLFYSGTIKPKQTMVIPSPADGVIIEMPLQYGESVKTGQLLFKIASAKFLADYKSAFLQYVKAKSDFNNGQMQLSEAEFLHKNLLISDDDFKTKQSNFYASRLALLQAKDALDVFLQQLNIKNIDLDKLTIADIDKITNAIHLQSSSDSLQITAPTSGILLSTMKSEDEIKKFSKGDNVKQGDVLAVIGDMDSITVHIKVNELTINQLKPGQRVSVTGIAFPGITLAGKIERIDRQGEVSSNGLPTFGIDIISTGLTEKQREQIHVGMSAKVQIDVTEPTQILLPIAALQEKDGVAFVNVLDEHLHKVKQRMVKTGKSTPDAVTIIAGLNSGDRVVIPD